MSPMRFTSRRFFLYRGPQGLIGALILGWRHPIEPSADAVHLVEAVSSYAAMIIDDVGVHERERHLATEAAARSAELAAVIDHIPDGVYVADLEGRIVLMKQGHAELSAPLVDHITAQNFIPAGLHATGAGRPAGTEGRPVALAGTAARETTKSPPTANAASRRPTPPARDARRPCSS